MWAREADQGWLWVEMVLVSAAGLLRWAFDCYFTGILPMLFVERALAILGLLFLVPAFHKSRFCYFRATDGTFLAGIKVDRRNQAAFEDALKIVRQKADLITETSPDSPLPDTAPVYETTAIGYLNSLARSTARFYEDKLIDVGKDLVQEMTTEIHYRELSGKTRVVRAGEHKWDNIFFFWLVLVATVAILTSLFLPREIWTSPTYTRILLGALLLLVPLFLLRYVKSELLLLYNNSDQVIYWTRINAANRKTLEQALEFIRGKVASRNT